MKARSLARDKVGFTVAPSPLNAVKLELALVGIGGALLWLLQDRIVADALGQLALLAGYGAAGAAWLVYRARAVVRRERARAGGAVD